MSREMHGVVTAVHDVSTRNGSLCSSPYCMPGPHFLHSIHNKTKI